MPRKSLEELEIDAFLSQSELLARLVADPSWPAWEALLTKMRQATLEELAVARDPQEMARFQGAAVILGEVLERPHRMIGAAADRQRVEEEAKINMRPELRATLGFGIDREGEF